MPSLNLTAAAIHKLQYDPSGPSRQVLWDEKVAGLGVRVMPTGNRSYVLSYRLHGRSRLMHLGRVADFENVKDARDTATEHLRLIRRDKLDPLAERRRERTAGTLKQMFKQWLAAIEKKRSAATIKNYRYYVDGYLTELGSHRPQDVTRGDVRRLHAKLTEANGAITANRCAQTLRAAFSWALKQDADTLPPGFVNPCAGLEFNREKPRDEFIAPDELPAVVREVQAIADPWVRGFLWLMLLTGARGGELLRLKWSDVSLEAGEIVLRETKNKTDFRLKIPGAAVDLLRSMPRSSDDSVFPATRRGAKRPHMDRPRAAWAGVLKRAGITRRITLHDVRRSTGVLLSARGFTAEQIARQLNHKSNITARIYVRIADDLQQRMADVLGSAAGGTTAPASVVPIPTPQERARRDRASL